MEKTTTMEVTTWLEGWTDTERYQYGAESVLDTPGTECGPKQMDCCRPEQMGTEEFGNMLMRIQTLEDGRVPAKEAKHWRIEGQRKITRKEYPRLVNKFEMEGFMAQKKACGTLRGRKSSAREESCPRKKVML